MANKISIINSKGGVGKTTSAVNLASALCIKQFKVLLIDLDAQCNTSTSLGIMDDKYNSYSIIKGKPIKYHQINNTLFNNTLFLVPSSINIATIDIELINEPGKEQIIKELLEKVEYLFDYIIFDCSPKIGLVAINALVASNYYIVPLLPHHLSIEGIVTLLDITDKVKRRINPDLELGGFLLTQYSNRKVLHKQTAQSIKKHFGDKLFDTYIRENISLAEAPFAKTSIFEYAPKSNGATDYMKLTEEIIQKLN